MVPYAWVSANWGWTFLGISQGREAWSDAVVFSADRLDEVLTELSPSRVLLLGDHGAPETDGTEVRRGPVDGIPVPLEGGLAFDDGTSAWAVIVPPRSESGQSPSHEWVRLDSVGNQHPAALARFVFEVMWPSASVE
jgi:hypothetical protein